MTLEPCLARQITYKNEKLKCVVMHRNIPKSGHFRPLERPKNAIFKDINLKFGTHTYQDVPSDIYSGFLKFLKIFQNILEKPKFWF